MNSLRTRHSEPAADPVIIRAWVEGWTLSRDTPPPVPMESGVRVDVGQPRHRVRYVFWRFDPPAVQRVMQGERESGAFIKICAAADRVAPLLPSHWTLQEPCYVMTMPLEAGKHDRLSTIPSGYTISTRCNRAVMVTEVLAEDGSLAASGQMALHGRFCIADQIVTSAEHRRRGLASCVMRTLEREAAGAGATMGILVATQDGFGLYSTLGWNLHSHYSSAESQPIAG